MNPFLFDTVAKPTIDKAANWQICSEQETTNTAKPWPKALKIAGLAALAWANCAAAVDLNSASLSELLEVKGIGPKTAQIILAERDRAGEFKSFADLSDRVRGIGPKKVQTLQSSGLAIKQSNTTITKPEKK